MIHRVGKGPQNNQYLDSSGQVITRVLGRFLSP
jgi:hypothetical protein